MDRFYITTPIYYVNGDPHIGHAYTTIAADVAARYWRFRGRDVCFLVGMDENSQKNVEAAERLGKVDDIQGYLDEQSALWARTWDSLGITNDDFVRTTEERHKLAVEKFFKTVEEKGDIYKGVYKGYYCTGCEAFVVESDLEEGKCPIHKKEVEEIEEENYFFAASKYRDALLKHIETHPDFIQPAARRNEVVSYIRDHFNDVSISRQSVKWGIPLPSDPSHVVYVWFDALINYLTGIGYGTDDQQFETFWPCNVHLVGKDIIKFHCALWPAMLLSAGLQLPQSVFAHGFFTIDGHKISKSLGNTIDPVGLSERYGIDAVRYFLLREIPFGADGDFSFDRFDQRYSSDLAKGIGNFVSRVLALSTRLEDDEYSLDLDGSDAEIVELLSRTREKYDAGLLSFQFHEALEEVWRLISWGDKYVESQKPWALAKDDREGFVRTMVLLLELVRQLSLFLYPFMPQTAQAVAVQIGQTRFEDEEYATLCTWSPGTVRGVSKGESLFPSLE